MIEVVEAMKPVIVSNRLFKIAKHDQTSSMTYGYLTHYSIAISYDIALSALKVVFKSIERLARVLVSLLILVVFFAFRSWLHGEHTLYRWTVMENHIDGFPDLQSRILSYAQSHLWYALKLFYPKHLCFDYGYACLPTVHHLTDARNLLPLLCYSWFGAVVYNSILRLRLARIVALAAFLLPLLPALNIFLAVGTVLAERLLFVPSIGFCMALAEFIVDDCEWLWTAANGALEGAFFGKHKGKVRTLRYLLLPLVISCGLRVRSRNLDWQTEANLFSSSLTVCPTSIKALSNHAVLSATNKNFTSSKNSALEAIRFYPLHKAAYINSGIASTKLSHHLQSVALLEFARSLDSDDNRLFGYIANALQSWSEAQRQPIALKNALRQQSAEWLNLVLTASASPSPSVYHTAGTAALERGDLDAAKSYYLAALERSRNLNQIFRRNSKNVAIEDDVQHAHTYNQLGIVAKTAGQIEEAITYYKAGLESEPMYEALIVNLASMYLHLKRPADSLKTLQPLLAAKGENASFALFNNYGNVLMEIKDFKGALECFEKALVRFDSMSTSKREFTAVSEHGSVRDMIVSNIAGAKAQL